MKLSFSKEGSFFVCEENRDIYLCSSGVSKEFFSGSEVSAFFLSIGKKPAEGHRLVRLSNRDGLGEKYALIGGYYYYLEGKSLDSIFSELKIKASKGSAKVYVKAV